MRRRPMLRTLTTLLLAFALAHTATAADFRPFAPPGPYRLGFSTKNTRMGGVSADVGTM